MTALVRVIFFILCLMCPRLWGESNRSDFRTLQSDQVIVFSDCTRTQMNTVLREVERALYIMKRSFPGSMSFLPLPVEVLLMQDSTDLQRLAKDLPYRNQGNSKTSEMSCFNPFMEPESVALRTLLQAPDSDSEEQRAGYVHWHAWGIRAITSSRTFNAFLPQLYRSLAVATLQYSMEKVPLWLGLGNGEFFSTLHRTTDSYQLGFYKKNQIEEVRSGKLPSINQLMRLRSTSRLVLEKDEDKIEHLKLSASFFISFLQFFDKRRYQVSYRRYLNSLVKGVPEKKAFLNCFPQGMIPLEGGFRRYVRNYRIPFTQIAVNSFPEMKNIEEGEMSRGFSNLLWSEEFLSKGNILMAQRYMARMSSTEASRTAALVHRLRLAHTMQNRSSEKEMVQQLIGSVNQSSHELRTLRKVLTTLACTGYFQDACGFIKSQKLVSIQDPPTLKLIFKVATRCHDTSLKRASLTQLIRSFPDHPRWLRHIVATYQQEQKFAAAAGYEYRLLRVTGESTDMQHFKSLFAKIENPQKAAALLIQLRQAAPDDALLMELLADLYHEQGNDHAALYNYRLLLKSNPQRKDIAEKIVSLEKALEKSEKELRN